MIPPSVSFLRVLQLALVGLMFAATTTAASARDAVPYGDELDQYITKSGQQITIPEDAPMRDDWRQAVQSFMEKEVFPHEVRKLPPEQAMMLTELAVRFVGLRFYAKDKQGNFEAWAAVREEAEALLSDGAETGLTYWILGVSTDKSTRAWREAREVYLEWSKSEVKENTHPLLSALILFGWEQNSYKGKHGPKAKTVIAIMDHLREALQNPQINRPEYDPVLLDILFGVFEERFTTIEEAHANIRAFVEEEPMSDWLRHCLRGELGIRDAWDARGGGWASSVTEEGWDAFGENLKIAGEHFLAAHEINPLLPGPARRLIVVSMGGGALGGKGEHYWLQEAMRACVGDTAALDAYRNSIQNRWGGDVEEMLGFGLACARAGERAEGTPMPLFLFNALYFLSVENDVDWKGLLRNTPVGEQVLATSRMVATHPNYSEYQRTVQKDYHVFWAWASGHIEEAAEYLGGREALPEDVNRWAQSFGVEPEKMLQEIKLHGNPALARIADLEGRVLEGDTVQLERELGALLVEFPELSNEMAVVDLKKAIDFERKLAAGDWVTLEVDDAMLNWQTHYGEWSCEDGNLVNVGIDNRALVLFKFKPGGRYEMSCQYAIESDENCCKVVQWVMAYHYDTGQAERRDQFVGVGIYQNGGAKGRPSFRNDFATAGPWNGHFFEYAYLKGPIDMHVTVDGERVSLTLDDVQHFDAAIPSVSKKYSDPIELFPDGQVGFMMPRSCSANKTIISNIKVRRILSEEEA